MHFSDNSLVTTRSTTANTVISHEIHGADRMTAIMELKDEDEDGDGDGDGDGDSDDEYSNSGESESESESESDDDNSSTWAVSENSHASYAPPLHNGSDDKGNNTRISRIGSMTSVLSCASTQSAKSRKSKKKRKSKHPSVITTTTTTTAAVATAVTMKSNTNNRDRDLITPKTTDSKDNVDPFFSVLPNLTAERAYSKPSSAATSTPVSPRNLSDSEETNVHTHSETQNKSTPRKRILGKLKQTLSKFSV